MGRRELSAKRGVKAGEVDGLPAACCAPLHLQFVFKGECTMQSHRHIFFKVPESYTAACLCLTESELWRLAYPELIASP